MMKKPKRNNKSPYKSKANSSYCRFINYLEQHGSLYDEKLLNETGKALCLKAKEVKAKIQAFNKDISPLPVMALIYLFIDSVGKNFVEKYLSMLCELIEVKILPHQHDGVPISIGEFKDLHTGIISDIRCFNDWSIEKRELFVREIA